MKQFRILNEIKSKLPPLRPEEYVALEKSLLTYGCRDALVVWDGILLDGYNRYKICEHHGIEYRTKQIRLDSMDEAIEWVLKNQIGRQNLTADQFQYTVGELYNRRKKQGERTDLTSGKNYQKLTTAEELAEQYGIGEKTVRRAGKFVDQLTDDPELKDAILRGKSVKEIKKARRKQKHEDKYRTMVFINN